MPIAFCPSLAINNISNLHLISHSELEAEVDNLNQLMRTIINQILPSKPNDLVVPRYTSLVVDRDKEIKGTIDDVKFKIEALES